MKWFFICVCLFFAMILFDGVNVNADYYDICSEKLHGQNEGYTDCGNNNIYLMKNNKGKSSYIVANRDLVKKNKIIYAGVVDGLDTFYSSYFNFYSVIYDDRSIGSSSENIWSDISINGVVVYSGKFDDHILFDDSKNQYVGAFYNEVGTYVIRQYIGNKVYSAIRMVVVARDVYSLDVEEVKYGENLITSPGLILNNSDLSFKITGGKYGFSKDVELEINECKFVVEFSKELVVSGDLINGCLRKNYTNKVTLKLYDGLNKYRIFKYSFDLYSNDVSIMLEDSYNALESTSRRIVINATAGKDKNLDESNCLYYWSKNPNDKLAYEEFMTNYELSDDKGSYTASKGVILRDSVGTYYLYAMAKDDDSVVVVRSNEYVLKKSKRVNEVIVTDFIFVGVLCLGAVIPVFVYLIIRGKDTY